MGRSVDGKRNILWGWPNVVLRAQTSKLVAAYNAVRVEHL